MQKIVFEYDPLRSKKNRQFTVRLSERQRVGYKWIKKGPNIVYFGSDLKKIMDGVTDYFLFRKVLESEMEFRKVEGRFASEQDEYTILRVSPYDLKEFVEETKRNKGLCDKEGNILEFRYISNVEPEIVFQSGSDGYFIGVNLQEFEYAKLEYTLRSKQVIAVCKDKILAVHPDIPQNFFQSLPLDRKIPFKDLDNMQKNLSVFGDKIILRFNGKTFSKKEDFRPILDFISSLKTASLRFQYTDKLSVKRDDTRKVFFDLANAVEIQRNSSLEDKYIDLLKQAGARYRPSKNGDWLFPASNLDRILENLNEKGFKLQIEHKPFRIDTKHDWHIRVEDHHIHIRGIISCNERKADLTSIFKAFVNNQQYFPISDGSYGYISSPLKMDLHRLFENGLIKEDEIVIKDFHFQDVSEIFQAKNDAHVDERFKDMLTFEKEMGKLKAYPVPESLKHILRPYQKFGYYWLSSLNELGFSGILADDMGLGKTLQVLTLILGLKQTTKSGPSLLIVPKTLIYNWEIEIEKFTLSLTYILHTGKGRKRHEINSNGHDLVITSYALMRLDFDIFDKIRWSYLILDEAQAIKNPSAQVSQAIKRINAEHRLSLSGTPVENSPVDLWGHFDFLMPGFFQDIDQFKQRYNGRDPKDLRLLSEKIKPFILRRLKSQVCSELPPKTEITLFCEFSDDQRHLYDKVVLSGKREIAEKKAEQKSLSLHILTLLLRLRQIACHPFLALPDSYKYTMTSGKHEIVLETAEKIISEGHKILVFSQFTEHLKILKKAFISHGIEFFYLDGSTNDRQEVIQSFQAYRYPCVFFMSLKAGGLGLNLTEASYVFLLDPWWNPAVENQAIDRCYRIGQENPVTVYRFITKDSIEERVSELQEIKNAMEKAIISETDIDHVPLNEKRLEALLDVL